MTIGKAIQQTIEKFPFPGYMLPSGSDKARNAYITVAEVALRYLKPGSKILDFGSGPCDKTAVLQQLGFHCSAYDDLQDEWHRLPGNPEKIIAFTKQCGIDFQLADESKKLPFAKNSFDMIMLHDVLEHLHSSPRDLLNDLLELAKPDGLLFVTVPNAVNIRKRIDVLFGRTNLPRFEGYYWYPGVWRGHIREYVRGDLVQLANYLDLDILEVRSCDHMLQKLPTALRPFYLLLTGIFSGWKDSWILVAKKRTDWAPKKSLPDTDLMRILGKGTSYDYAQ